MTSWIYLFSDFTGEALLFEGLGILLLSCAYAAFWILKKRRFGVVDKDLPSGPVKAYLNELIFNAEQLRAQLFGLLAQGTPTQAWTPHMPAGDPGLSQKVIVLESKLAEQAKALDALASEKGTLEKTLDEAKAALAAQGAADQGDNPEFKKMMEKIKTLEGRLAEYSVIEDDLANLKRFQQENAQLKTLLSSKGISVPEGGVPVSNAPSSGAGAAGAATPEVDAAPRTNEERVDAEPATEAPEAPAAEPESKKTAPGPALAPEAAESAPQIPEPVTKSATVDPAPDKAEEDLVAEFEKMLKG